MPYRSVAENICLGREPRRFGLLDWRAHARRGARAACAASRSTSTCAARSMAYRTAIQQMVAIARAVVFEAKLVIMDEPTSSLDEREVAVLFDVIRQLKARRRVGDLRQPPARRALRGLRPRHHHARRPHRAGRARWPSMSKLELVAAMLGRELTAGRGRRRHRLPRQAAGDRHASLARRPSISRPAARCATSASRFAPARSSAWPGCSAPAAPRRRARSSAPTEPDGGTIALRRAARTRFATPAGRHRGRHRLLLGGPQGRGHRPRHVACART